jgi:hypothetical protein
MAKDPTKRDDNDLRVEAASLIVACERIAKKLAVNATDTLRHRLDKESTKLDMVMARAAADPFYSCDLLCWCVDIIGTMNATKEQVEVALASGVTPKALRKAICEFGGDLAELVFLAIERWGCNINEAGVGIDNWHLGVQCDDQACTRICALLHRDFALEIAKKQISVMKRHTGFRFKDMLDGDDARRLLHKVGQDRT